METLKDYNEYFDKQVELSREGGCRHEIHRLICLGHYAAKVQGEPYDNMLAEMGKQYSMPN